MAVTLTADICARGVIASARYLGYDPVAAMLAKRGPPRTAVTAAALAAQRLTGIRRDATGRVFGVLPTSLARCERVSTKGFEKACDAASRAMVAAGLNAPAPDVAPLPATTVRAPAWQVNEVASPVAAPVIPTQLAPRPPVDHTAAIRAALAKMKTAPKHEGVRITVVGVEADKASPPAEPHTCRWPLGDLHQGTLRSCGAEAVTGRMYCPRHCTASGQKATPKQIEVVGRVAEPYRDPRADNAVGRKAAY